MPTVDWKSRESHLPTLGKLFTHIHYASIHKQCNLILSKVTAPLAESSCSLLQCL